MKRIMPETDKSNKDKDLVVAGISLPIRLSGDAEHQEKVLEYAHFMLKRSEMRLPIVNTLKAALLTVIDFSEEHLRLQEEDSSLADSNEKRRPYIDPLVEAKLDELLERLNKKLG